MFGRCWDPKVEFGSYDNTVLMCHPERDIVTIDTCIASEIGYLWTQGIDTINSCCGHGKNVPSVIVSERDYEKMDKLGYKSYDRPHLSRVHILKTKAYRTPKIIVLFGAPGSGKSTQGKMLEEKIGYKFISLGDVFRSINNPRIQEQLKTEKLFSDGEAFEILQAELLKYDKVILDGFPRNIKQLSLLNCGQFEIEDVICLQVTKEVAKERMSKRGRNQDTDSVIEKRLSTYFKTESQMKESFLEQFGKRITINGEEHPELISKAIEKHLNF